MRTPWIPLKDGHYHVRDDCHINVTLNYPPDHGNFTRSNWNIVLNATLRTSGSDATVDLYASDEPSIDGENCLVHRRTGAANGTTVRYNLDSLPVKPDRSTVLLLHFDNRSEHGENATHVRDFSGNGNNATVMGEAVHSNAGGKFAGAFKLDRTDDYVTVPHDSNFNSVNRSAECWVKLDLEGHIGYLMGRQGWGVNESYLMIRYSWSFITAWVGNGTSQPSVSYELPAGNRTGV